MATFKNHFSTGSAGYAAHRPVYPQVLVDWLADAAPAQTLALDCGCGTGQLSALLATRFDQVVATDASAEQIAHATPHPRVEYRTAAAERSGLSSGRVDLVTVAQAAHWLDLDGFYAEVRRVARPRAIVALITYGILHVDAGEADAVIRHFYHETIGPYWPPERKHVEDGYRALPFPFEESEAPVLSIDASWGLDDLIGYTETWSAVRQAETTVRRDPIDAFRAELTKAWGDPHTRRRVNWPLSLRVGRV